LGLSATVAAVALALQFGIVVEDHGLGPGLFLYTGFFTIWTNTLLAVALTLTLAAPGSRAARFLSTPPAITGMAASILVVGGVYHLLLRRLWNPQGLQLFTDLLHTAVPVLFLIVWWIRAAPQRPRLGAVARWLAYPAVYFAFALARGAIFGTYPYPFFDDPSLGYGRVFVNASAILASYVVLMALLTAASSWATAFRVGRPARG
jgi:hypothetical protein